jgi:tetratricopeptide (TPR) repeat protein
MLAALLMLAAAQKLPAPTEALVFEARSAFEAGRYAEARGKLHEAVRRAPANPALWSYLGLVDVQLNDLDAAVSDFQKTLEFAPDDAQSLFNLGLLYGRKNDTEKASDAYLRGLKLEPDNAGANQNFALLLMAQNRFREAVPSLERLCRAKPLDLAAHAALLGCYAKARMDNEVARETEAILGLPDLTAAEGLRLAKMLLDDQQTESARMILARVTKLAPESTEAHYDLGLMYLNKSDYEAAVREFGYAVQLAPQTAGSALRLAETLILWKRYGTALEFLNAVKDRFGSLPDYRYKLGLAYYGLHKFPLAIAIFEQLAKEQPPLDTNHFFLGNCYGAIGDLDKSESEYRVAIRIRPDNASYHTALAQVLRKVSDENADEAIAHLQKAIALDPADVPSKHELALCYLTKGNYERAAQLLEEVVSKEPDLTAARVGLARAYYKLHRKADGDRENASVRRLEAAAQEKQNALRNAGAHPAP